MEKGGGEEGRGRGGEEGGRGGGGRFSNTAAETFRCGAVRRLEAMGYSRGHNV